MPLTNPVERELIHERTIECKGYKRKDDLWDIEGHLVDIKSYEFPNYDRNGIAAGEPIHDMWLRITVDNNMLIHEAEAVTDASPFNICPNITSNFTQLKGLQIKQGWRGSVNKIVGGTQGCTHLVELLNPLATTAFQTIYPLVSQEMTSSIPGKKPLLLNSCHAYAANSSVVKRQWPTFYEGEE
tara:strand:- start:1944 stop:2495 length:552 start_codon:yes stop_codon:yes gene_type:complete